MWLADPRSLNIFAHGWFAHRSHRQRSSMSSWFEISVLALAFGIVLGVTLYVAPRCNGAGPSIRMGSSMVLAGCPPIPHASHGGN